MANLLGQDIGLNYKGIITIGSTINQNVSASLQSLTDGDGNALPIQVSTTNTQLGYGVGIGGAPSTDGLKVYGQSGTTGMSLIGVGATMYVDLNGTGTNFFDSVETRYRNAAGTNIAMNVWGNLGRVAIGGLGTNYTPTASLQVRGDGTNPMFIVETSAGGAVLNANATGNNLTFSASNVSPTSGTTTLFNLTNTLASAAGNANYRPISIAYTINNTGAQTGTTTGIFLNATLTNLNGMNHNLMDLQVGGVSAFKVQNNVSGIGITTSGSWVAYNNSATQLVGIQGGIFYIFNTSARFEINLSTNQVTLSGRLLGSASTTARATLNIPSGVAPTTPSNGDIWFDGTNIFMRIGGVTKTFTLTP
jgi:hypothetical protein